MTSPTVNLKSTFGLQKRYSLVKKLRALLVLIIWDSSLSFTKKKTDNDCLRVKVKNINSNGEKIEEEMCLRALPVDITAFKDVSVIYNPETKAYGYATVVNNLRSPREYDMTNPHTRELAVWWNEDPELNLDQEPDNHSDEWRAWWSSVGDFVKDNNKDGKNMRQVKNMRDMIKSFDKMTKNGYAGDFSNDFGKTELYANNRHDVTDACLRMFKEMPNGYDTEGRVTWDNFGTKVWECKSLPGLRRSNWNENDGRWYQDNAGTGKFSSAQDVNGRLTDRFDWVDQLGN